MKPNAVFLDVGANLGIHSLFAARLGFNVWSIEPQIENLKKVTIGYILSIYIYIYILLILSLI